MKSNLYILLLLLFTAGAVFCQLPVSIPTDLLEKYENLENIQQSSGNEESKYQSPTIKTMDTLLIPDTEDEKEVKVEDFEYGVFEEYVVINDDTIQVIRKAFPKDLNLYGIELFKNRTKSKSNIVSGIVTEDYILGPGDEFTINIWGDNNFQYELSIDNEGNIFIPRAGSINLNGQSLKDANYLIKKKLNRIYSNYKSSLTLTRVKPIKVYVVGEVQKPGAYSVSGLTNVINAIEIAGGPSEIGSYRNIKIIRNKKVVETLDLYKLLSEGNETGNINLAQNDIILIPKLHGRVKLRGLVLKPAIYEIDSATTFNELFEISGGILPSANKHAIFVDRVIDGNHIIETIDFTDSLELNSLVKNLDDISVFASSPIRENVVFVEGHATHAGSFNLSEKTTIRDFILNSNILHKDTYVDRINIYRQISNFDRRIIPINLKNVLDDPNSTENILLENQDIIRFYSIWNFKEPKMVQISGAIRIPGEYLMYAGMRVSDLIFEAGGLKENAYKVNAELSRNAKDRPPEIFSLNLKDILENRGCPSDIVLKEDDQLFIRLNPVWKEPRVVTIEGEVQFPGKYTLVKENENLDDLINRAGGFTEFAYSKGALFKRNLVEKSIEQRNLNDILRKTMPAIYDSLTNRMVVDFELDNLNRIIVDLEQIGSKSNNIVLEDGDFIYIPKISSIVSVKGAVAFEGTINFQENKKVKYYLERAGGLLKNADKSEIRIIKYNGKTLKVSQNYNKVEPGDVIIIPEEIAQKRDILKTLSTTASLLASLATTIYIIMKL